MLPDAKRPRLDLSKVTLRQCRKVLEVLEKMPEAGPFLAPVDPVMLRIPDYPKIVKTPMDFGTIEKKLGEGAYQDTDTFASDVRQVFHNSYIYNKKDSPVGAATKVLEDAFEAKLGALVASSGATPTLARAPSLAPISLVSSGPALISSIKPIVKSLVSHALSGPFRLPLDWQTLGLTTYLDVIKTPMDLSTVMKKLEESAYTNVAGVKCDLDLVWENCITFNTRDSWVGKHAVTLRDFTAKKFTQAKLTDDQLLSSETGTPRKGLGGPVKGLVPKPSALPEVVGRKPPTKRYRAGDEPKEEPLALAPARAPAPAPAAAPAMAPTVVSARLAAASVEATVASALTTEGDGEGPILLTMSQCSRLLKPILNHTKAANFLQPVDWKTCARGGASHYAAARPAPPLPAPSPPAPLPAGPLPPCPLARVQRRWPSAPLAHTRYKLIDYPDVITEPMDLGTIDKKLTSRVYTTGADAFVRDVRLVWANAIRHVPRTHR